MQLIARGFPPQASKVMILTAGGFGEKETARRLNLEVATVKKHRMNIRYKLHAKNMNEAISKAFAQGNLQWLPLIALLICVSALGGVDQRVRVRPLRVSTALVRVVKV